MAWGGPIQIAQVTPGEGARMLDDIELEEINTQVGLWRELERETLEQLLGEENVEAEGEPMPEIATAAEAADQ